MKPVAIVVSMLIAALSMAGCSFWEDLPVEKEQETDTTVTLIHQGGMVLVKAKDSSFRMGSNLVENAQPVHTVRFTYDFWMDTSEVTQRRFDSVMKAAYPGYVSDAWDATYGKGNRSPVFYRTWYDAVLYCNALSIAEQLACVYAYDSIAGTPGNRCIFNSTTITLNANGYRLPTEAEWEYACRGGDTTEYYWGSGNPKEYAWYNSNSGDTAHPVAQKKPNAFGLYDMCGNVMEWCIDWYDNYSDTSVIDPVALSPTSKKRVVRGGGWNNDIAVIKSSYRYLLYPSLSETAIVPFGFRTVRKKL
jgi:formylglycine-generating enzyme